jgi:hypothetical protein
MIDGCSQNKKTWTIFYLKLNQVNTANTYYFIQRTSSSGKENRTLPFKFIK